MNSFAIALLSLSTGLAAAGAQAQQEVEPGVQTSSAAAPVGHPASSPNQAVTPATPPARTPAAQAAAKQAVPPASPAATPTAAATPDSKAASAKGGKASDRIQLDTTEISGNRELPKVMYVVPWRRADPGDFSGRPLNSLLDEALTPVDRDVFRRQNRYYAALQATPEGPSSPPESKDEK